MIGPELAAETSRRFPPRPLQRRGATRAPAEEDCGRIEEGDDNPLFELRGLGQSVWLDYVRRGLITSGELKRLVDEDAVAGMTSNPTIFNKAIAGSSDYDDALRALVDERRRDPRSSSCVWRSRTSAWSPTSCGRSTRATAGGDGFVSLEVSPRLAHDTGGHDRRGVAAIRERLRPAERDDQGAGHARRACRPSRLTARGRQRQRDAAIRVKAYEQVVQAYISGLERRAGRRSAHRWHRQVASASSSRGWIPPSTRSTPEAHRRCGARSPSPTRRSRTRCSRSSSPARAGSGWQRPGHGCSGCSGPRRARRTRATPTCCTSRS